jgi:hypothetical protein
MVAQAICTMLTSSGNLLSTGPNPMPAERFENSFGGSLIFFFFLLDLLIYLQSVEIHSANGVLES